MARRRHQCGPQFTALQVVCVFVLGGPYLIYHFAYKICTKPIVKHVKRRMRLREFRRMVPVPAWSPVPEAAMDANAAEVEFSTKTSGRRRMSLSGDGDAGGVDGERKQKRQLKNFTLRALAPRRKSKEEKEKNQGGKMHSQLQSPFFARLPWEVRQMVYAYVFEGGDVHIVAMHGRLGSFRCLRDDGNNDEADDDNHIKHVMYFNLENGKRSGNDDNSWHCESCFQREVTEITLPERGTDAPVVRTYANTGIGVLSLLQACRKTYTESLPLLYASHTFTFRFPDALLYFLSITPPTHLRHITALTFDGVPQYPDRHHSYAYPIDSLPAFYLLQYREQLLASAWVGGDGCRGSDGDDAAAAVDWSQLFCVMPTRMFRIWDAAFLALSSRMVGLRTLRVRLAKICFFGGAASAESVGLGVLTKVRCIRGGGVGKRSGDGIFEVEVDWEGKEGFEEVPNVINITKEEVPFVLKRTVVS